MIEVETHDGIAVLRLIHGKANAMSTEFCRALTGWVAEFRASPARAAVITGQGKIFSAGVDLLRLSEGGAPYVREFLPALNAMFEAVFQCDKPVVAAINGHAIAGGCVLACAADRRLMGREAGRIGVTELLVGVPFPAGAMEIMRRAVAPQCARRSDLRRRHLPAGGRARPRPDRRGGGGRRADRARGRGREDARRAAANNLRADQAADAGGSRSSGSRATAPASTPR